MRHALKCAVTAALFLPFSSQLTEARSIRLISAVYGTPETNMVCNATAQVASMCDGQRSCAVPIMNTNLCGDPDFMIVKKVAITYRCGRHVASVAASEYTLASVGCE